MVTVVSKACSDDTDLIQLRLCMRTPSFYTTTTIPLLFSISKLSLQYLYRYNPYHRVLWTQDFVVSTRRSQVRSRCHCFRAQEIVIIRMLKPCVFLLLQDCKNDKTSNISVDLVDNSPFHLIGSFLGPEETPYEGGHFQVVRPAFILTERPRSRMLILLYSWLGHCHSGFLPLSARQDEVHHEALPP